MKKISVFLLLLVLLSGSASVFAQSPFPLAVPTRPTTFPLPIPTRPAVSGYAFISGKSAAPLSGSLQGTICLIDGEMALDASGRAHALSWASPLAAALPSNLVYISYGGSTAAAITASGSAHVTGNYWIASGGSGSASSLVPAEASQDVVQVATADTGKWLALKGSGQVIQWQATNRTEFLNGSNQPVPVFPVPALALSNVVSIALAEEHCLALRADGRVVAWGRVATNTATLNTWASPIYADASTILPPEVSSDVVAIAAGPHNGIALKQNGTVVQWGKAMDQNSRLLSELPPVPTELSTNTIVAVAAEKFSSVVSALTSDGDAYMWGSPYGTPYSTKLKGRKLVQASPGYAGEGLVALSVSEESAFADVVGFPLDKLAQLVAQKIIAAVPDNYGIATKSDLTVAATNAVAQVLASPGSYNLFTLAQNQAKYNEGVTAGTSLVTANPASYNLYTSNSIMDLRMGGLMIQRQGTNAVVSFQPQTTTDLTQPFTNNGTPITNTIPMPGNKGFIRINAKP